MSENGKSDFDDMVDAIQQEIEADESSTFSRKVIEEFRDPKNAGRMGDADAVGIITGPCGDTMEFYLNIQDSRVADILFMTDGCGSTIACGSMLTQLVQDKYIEEVEKITDTDLQDALDGLPKENMHCAKLAVDTLMEALRNWHTKGDGSPTNH